MFFPKLILTDAGRALIVKALNGTAINFTKFALGDGTAPKEPRKLKALVHLAANMQINSIELSANCAVLESTYTNSGLKSKLVARELGIFATDPDEGEILYAYANAGSEASVVPPESGDMTVPGNIPHGCDRGRCNDRHGNIGRVFWLCQQGRPAKPY